MNSFREICEAVQRKLETNESSRVEFRTWLLSFYKSDEKDILQDEKKTRGQSTNEDWFLRRQKCVTASSASDFLSVWRRGVQPTESEQFDCAFKLLKRFPRLIGLESKMIDVKKRQHCTNIIPLRFGLENESTVKLLLQHFVAPWMCDTGKTLSDCIETDMGFLRSPELSFIGASLDAIEDSISTGRTLFEIKCLMDMNVDTLDEAVDAEKALQLLQAHRVHSTKGILYKSKKFFSATDFKGRGHSALLSYVKSARQLNALLFDFQYDENDIISLKSVSEFLPGQLVCHPYHKYSVQVCIQSYVIDTLCHRPLGTCRGYVCVPIWSSQNVRIITFNAFTEVTLKPIQRTPRGLLLIPIALDRIYIEDIILGLSRNFSMLSFAALCDYFMSGKNIFLNFAEAKQALFRHFTLEIPALYLQPLSVSKILMSKKKKARQKPKRHKKIRILEYDSSE